MVGGKKLDILGDAVGAKLEGDDVRLLCVAWGNKLRVALNLLVLSVGVEKFSCCGL